MRATRPELIARLEELERATRERPDDGPARSEYGWVLLLVGRIGEGVAELEAAVELVPTDPIARRRLGVGLYRDGRHEECVAELRSALALASAEGTGAGPQTGPGAADGEAYYYLGCALEQLGDRNEALGEFRRASEVAPKHPEARYREALLVVDDAPDRARALLEEVLELDAFHPGAAINLARLYRRAGRSDEAREMLARHQEIGLLADLGLLDAPLSVERFLGEARYYARQQKLGEALEVVERGLELHAEDPRLTQLRAELRAGPAERGDG